VYDFCVLNFKRFGGAGVIWIFALVRCCSKVDTQSNRTLMTLLLAGICTISAIGVETYAVPLAQNITLGAADMFSTNVPIFIEYQLIPWLTHLAGSYVVSELVPRIFPRNKQDYGNALNKERNSKLTEGNALNKERNSKLTEGNDIAQSNVAEQAKQAKAQQALTKAQQDNLEYQEEQAKAQQALTKAQQDNLKLQEQQAEAQQALTKAQQDNLEYQERQAKAQTDGTDVMRNRETLQREQLKLERERFEFEKRKYEEEKVERAAERAERAKQWKAERDEAEKKLALLERYVDQPPMAAVEVLQSTVGSPIRREPMVDQEQLVGMVVKPSLADFQKSVLSVYDSLESDLPQPPSSIPDMFVGHILTPEEKMKDLQARLIALGGPRRSTDIQLKVAEKILAQP
jgi:hypothetical protein